MNVRKKLENKLINFSLVVIRAFVVKIPDKKSVRSIKEEKEEVVGESRIYLMTDNRQDTAQHANILKRTSACNVIYCTNILYRGISNRAYFYGLRYTVYCV